MPSAWHTPDDPREFSDPPITVACDGCGRDMRLAAEDWHDDGMGTYCPRCVAETAHDAPDTTNWPEDLWF
jgi:predicted amidophosphoribosyltransferase